MAKGIVKWFNVAKGFGFISSEEVGEEDIFVHFTSITGTGFKKLIRGQEVTFKIEKGSKGLHALEVIGEDIIHDDFEMTAMEAAKSSARVTEETAETE